MNIPAPALPAAQRKILHRARWIEVIWLGVLGSIVVAIYFSLGNSQAMKTAWIEDMLSFIPPIAFLVASWIEGWSPSRRFPRGFISVSTLAYLISAVALGGVGIFLIVDSATALIKAEHPTIGSVDLFGTTIWFGWVMIAALIYSVILPVIFGRLKLGPAQELHDKTLWADALMNKADWMTGVAAVVGILGIGMGWWWADAVAAILIALDVLHDGVSHTSAAIRDITGETPRTVDDADPDPLVEDVRRYVDDLPWVQDSALQLREEGRFLSGKIHVVAVESPVLPEQIEAAERDLRDLHWRIYELAIMPRTEIASEAGRVDSPRREGAASGS